MADRDAFRELHNSFLETTIEDFVKIRRYSSVQKVEVCEKQIKLKWFIFPYKKSITVVKFTVDEGLFVIESLIDNIDLRDIVPDTFELDIEYI